MENVLSYENESNNPLDLLIVEDSINYSIELEQLAQEVGFNVIATVDNSAQALDIIFSNPPDVILMDIDIKGRLSGIDIAKKIHHLNIPLLYLTSFGDEATYQKAVEANHVGFMLKPIDKFTLATSLKLLIKHSLLKQSESQNSINSLREKDNSFFFMKNNIYQKININHVSYIKSDGNYCEFKFDNGKSYHVRLKLHKAENLFKHKNFIRCHRQYIVNTMKIRSVDIPNLSLEVGDDHIPFSRTKKEEVLKIGVFLR